MIFSRMTEWISFLLSSLKKPVDIWRGIDWEGKKIIAVISKPLFRAPRTIAKFEIIREFSPEHFLPDWNEVEFVGYNFRTEKEVAVPPTTSSND